MSKLVRECDKHPNDFLGLGTEEFSKRFGELPRNIRRNSLDL